MAGILACKKDTHGVALQVGQILLKRMLAKGIYVLQPFRMNKYSVSTIPMPL